jgi:hypothetical protein
MTTSYSKTEKCSLSYDLSFKYLPATLTANDGNMMNTFINSSLNIKESSSSLPEVRMFNMPNTPNETEAQINIFVAIFCIVILYQDTLSSLLAYGHLTKDYQSPT